jgi:hypothetical protein
MIGVIVTLAMPDARGCLPFAAFTPNRRTHAGQVRSAQVRGGGRIPDGTEGSTG